MEETHLPDGRRAQLWTGGARAGPTVLVCHGTPDTRWVARTGADAASAAGVRLVAINRPGYGTSTPAPSTMTSVADDAVAMLDVLGLDSVAVLGMSVGGAYAAALAARHPDRVAALGVVASPTETRTAMGPVETMVEQARPEFAAWAATIHTADPDDDALAARFLASLPPADADLLAAALSPTELAISVREALARHDGYLRDAALLFGDWGLRFEDITAPTDLWYGADDNRNPPETGTWWTEQIPHAELTVTHTTHLATLLTNWPQILATLRSHLD